MAPFRNLRWSARRRLRRLRYSVEDAAYSARRATRRGSWGLSHWWSGMSPDARAVVVGAGVTLVALVLIVVAVIPNLPCQAPGGEGCPPSDDAIELVPADATAYAHLDTDPDSEQYERAAALADRVPTIADQILGELPGPDGAGVSYRRDVAPWLGGEAAVALVPAGAGRPRAVAVLEIDDEHRADRFAREVTGERPKAAGGADVAEGDGAAVARVDGFMVVGRPQQVDRAVETAGGDQALAEFGPAEDALDSLPDARLASLYLSEEGADELLAPGEPLGSFEAFVNAGATAGAGASLSVDEDALQLDVHSVLDPERADASPGFFAALPEFEPELGGELSEGALAYLALDDPAATLEDLLAQARAGAPGLATAFEALGQDVRRAGGVGLEQDLLPLLTSQIALAIEPGEGGPGDLAGTPYVTLIADEIDTEEATKALDRLQEPIAEAVGAGSTSENGSAFKQRKVDGVEVRTLEVSEAVELAYAIVDGKLVVSTDPRGVARVSADEGGVEGSDRYGNATDGFPDEVAALLYLNIDGLLTLAEQAGLQEDPSYALFRGEFEALEALGVAVDRGETELDTTIRLAIRE